MDEALQIKIRDLTFDRCTGRSAADKKKMDVVTACPELCYRRRKEIKLLAVDQASDAEQEVRLIGNPESPPGAHRRLGILRLQRPQLCRGIQRVEDNVEAVFGKAARGQQIARAKTVKQETVGQTVEYPTHKPMEPDLGSQYPVSPHQDPFACQAGKYGRCPRGQVSHAAQEDNDIELATGCNPQSVALPEYVLCQPPIAYKPPVEVPLGVERSRLFHGDGGKGRQVAFPIGEYDVAMLGIRAGEHL